MIKKEEICSFYAGVCGFLTPESLEQRASQLLSNKATLDGMLDKIAQLIASLVDHWNGEAQQAFSNSFN